MDFKQVLLGCDLDGPQPGERYFVKTPMITGRLQAPVPRSNICVTIRLSNGFIGFEESDFVVEHEMWGKWYELGHIKFLGYDT